MDHVLLDPLAVLRDLIRVLDNLAAPYLVGGSFASGIYGEFRATQDIDLLVDFAGIDPREFITSLIPTFFIDDVSVPRAISEAQSFNIIHRKTAFKVDIFTRLGDFERQELARAISVEAYGLSLQVKVASAEDCILAKLRWYEIGGRVSERQWNDMLGVIRIQRERLNLEYLTGWANKLGLTESLRKLLQA